ncbi:MAG: hypothetical protein N3F08_03375, partial [Crenarchaeota archaeon]|nr:hypothetical protein [Thermoproteota archaeon]
MKLSDLDKQKQVAFCLVLMIMLSLIRNQPIASYAQESGYESVAILLNNVRSARYRFSDEEGT